MTSFIITFYTIAMMLNGTPQVIFKTQIINYEQYPTEEACQKNMDILAAEVNKITSQVHNGKYAVITCKKK